MEKLPPLVLIVAGLIFLAWGASGGGLTVGQFKITLPPLPNKFVRVVIFIVGLFAAIFGAFLVFPSLQPSGQDCRIVNLLECSNFDRAARISQGSSVTARVVSGTLQIDFDNGNAQGDYSSVSLVFSSPLDVSRFNSVELKGTSTEDDISFVIEYKARSNGQISIVETSDYQSFPAGGDQTIGVPITYTGAIDEIAISFYTLGQSSTLDLSSVKLR